MQVKEKFSLLRNIPNTLSLPTAALRSYELEKTHELITSILYVNSKRISHFAKDHVIKMFKKEDFAKKFLVISLDDYILPVTYDIGNKKIIINLKALNTTDLAAVDAKTIFGCVIYGMCFESIVTGQIKIQDAYFSVFVNYLLSIIIRVYGKDYGLIGVYSTELPKLKFLLACYIINSFFGVTNYNSMVKTAASISGFDYKEVYDYLNKYDFSKIDDFIDSLSKMQVMPGITKYTFTAKLLRFLGLNFMPALEDPARFVSVLLVSTVGGAGIVPRFVYSYNDREFVKIIDLTKRIFN